MTKPLGEFTVEYRLRNKPTGEMFYVKLMTLSEVYDFMRCNRILCSHMRLKTKPVYNGSRSFLKPVRSQEYNHTAFSV